MVAAASAAATERPRPCRMLPRHRSPERRCSRAADDPGDERFRCSRRKARGELLRDPGWIRAPPRARTKFCHSRSPGGMRTDFSTHGEAGAPNPNHPSRTGAAQTMSFSRRRACTDHNRPSGLARYTGLRRERRPVQGRTRIGGCEHIAPVHAGMTYRASAAECADVRKVRAMFAAKKAVRKLICVAALHRSKAPSGGHVLFQYLPQYRVKTAPNVPGVSSRYCGSSSPSARRRLPASGSAPDRRSSWRTSSTSRASAAASAPAP